jgi:hypothetical protein
MRYRNRSLSLLAALKAKVLLVGINGSGLIIWSWAAIDSSHARGYPGVRKSARTRSTAHAERQAPPDRVRRETPLAATPGRDGGARTRSRPWTAGARAKLLRRAGGARGCCRLSSSPSGGARRRSARGQTSVDEIDSMEARVERLLLGGVLEPLLAEPLRPRRWSAGDARDADRTSRATADRAASPGARPRRASTSSPDRFRRRLLQGRRAPLASLARSGSGWSPQDYAPTKYEATNRRSQRNRFAARVGRVNASDTCGARAHNHGGGRARGHMVLAMAIYQFVSE